MNKLDRAFKKAYAEMPLAPNAAAEATSAPLVSKPMLSAAVAAIVPPEPTQPAPSASPLSSFAERPKIHDVASALLEVDHLAWPPACQSMQVHAEKALSGLADYLAERIGWGQKTIALASCRRAEGRTTVSLIMARLLAARGLRPVVVDADFENPRLARSCGIQDHTGWNELLEGETALGETLIAAVDERVTLMPWQGEPKSLRELTRCERVATNFNLLRDHYDIVLVDTMPLVDATEVQDFAGLAKAIGVDALYLVHDVRSTSAETLAETWTQLRREAVHVEGIIENFAAAESGRVVRVEPSPVADKPFAA